MDKIAHGGYDSLVECINPNTNKWRVIWNPQQDDEGNIYNYEIISNHKPTLNEIKDIIFTWYNEKTAQEIISEFTWNGNQVWLSIENQLNFKISYDYAIETGIIKPFKFGSEYEPVYYTFTTLEELKEFYNAYTTYVSDKREACWKAKDSIDWESYEQTLAAYD